MNDELEDMWKEAIEAHLKTLSYNLPTWTRKTTNNPSQYFRPPRRDSKPGPFESERGVLNHSNSTSTTHKFLTDISDSDLFRSLSIKLIFL
jgi:hypothetical protein